MTAPLALGTVEFGGDSDAPLLLLGPSLGTSATSLWQQCAQRLTGQFCVVGWELPGHGGSPPATGFDIPALAAGVLSIADARGVDRFHYAGDSVGGSVGLQMLADFPERVLAATLLCTSAQIGTPDGWKERAALVRASGTAALLDATPARWFGPGFAGRDAGTARALLSALAEADDESYAACCDALAGFDMRLRLSEIVTPVVVVAGACDPVVPAAHARRVATGVQHGRFIELDGVSHLAPAEAPEQVAALVSAPVPEVEHVSLAGSRAAGMRVRRQVLGDAHVDRAVAGTSEFNADFQDLITRYAWGEVWTRPGLDRRSRSLITLTALIARGHHDEFAMHVRAALRNGLTVEELREVLLQSAIYCGVPDANTAFRIAQRVLADQEGEQL